MQRCWATLQGQTCAEPLVSLQRPDFTTPEITAEQLDVDKTRRSGRVLHENARCLFTKRDEVEQMVLTSDEGEDDFEDLPDNTIDLSPWVTEVRRLPRTCTQTLTPSTDCLDGVCKAATGNRHATFQEAWVCGTLSI